MAKIELSNNQEQAVEHKEGAILVLANAGSGKTRILTERIKRLANSTKRKILAITFTNKAGEEMRDRLADLTNINEKLFIGTFHGFCQQVLENHGRHIGFDVMPHLFEDESERLELIEEAIEAAPTYLKEYSSLESKDKRNFRYKVLEYISEVKRNLLTEEQLLEENDGDEEIVLLFRAYQDILSTQNAIDFDDLILCTYNLFTENTKIADLYRRMYEFICIDEAQDLNNAQYQLLYSLTKDEHKNIMMVGDPNQSIFAFNGSSSDYMTKKFVDDYSPLVIELKENYRSSISVLNAAEKIIPDTNNINDYVKDGEFELHEALNENEEAGWICNKIKSLIELKQHPDIEGEITYSKIAVLARNRYVFKHLTDELEKNKFPYYFKTSPGAIKFESKSMKVFDLALKVKLNKQDRIHKNKLLSLLKLKTKIDTIDELIKIIKKPIYKSIIEHVVQLKEDGTNFKKTLISLKEIVKVSPEKIDDNNRNLIVNDISELETHWYNYAKKSDRKSIQQFKNSMALGKTYSVIEKKGITLSSVHTMKGQEYDIVFVMGMDDETFPDYRAIRKKGIELVQERNNAYVAFTRARRFLYVSYPTNRLMPWGDVKPRKKSRFLAEFK